MRITHGAAHSVTSPVKDGVGIDSEAPRYLHAKRSELKIETLADATRNATTRAN